MVVSHNSAGDIQGCVGPLMNAGGVRVHVVDNASSDGTRTLLATLAVNAIVRENNGGFASGCNAGWQAGSAPYVLFLNPDARIVPDAIQRLVQVLLNEAAVGAVGPRIEHSDGSLAFSQRRFPRRRSSLAQAIFLHRLPGAKKWGDDLVRDRSAYERSGEPDWVSGACILLRRTDLERLGGWDERFFMYREDIDLCRRLRAIGLTVRFEPTAVAVHLGGASARPEQMVPVLAASRVRYARKHDGRLGAAVERFSVGLHAVTHAVAGRGNAAHRAGHLRALLGALRSQRADAGTGPR